MSQSGSNGDVLAARLADIAQLSQELEDMNGCEESMSAETPVDINKDITQLSHPEEVSDVCCRQQCSNDQSDCPLGTDIKNTQVDTANESFGGRAMADVTTEEVEEPPDGPNGNIVIEPVNRRRRRPCLDGVDARPCNEGDENNSKDEFETHRKEEKPTNLEDLTEGSRNTKDTNLDMNGKNSKRRKLPITDEDYEWRNFIITSNDEDCAEKPTRRQETKVSNGKKTAIASSSIAKSIELVSSDESKDNSIDEEAAEQICIYDSDELTICDEVATSRSRNNTPKRRDLAEVTSVYPRRMAPPRSAGATSSVYPRRIVPPRSGGGYAGRRPIKPPPETHRKKKNLTKVEDLTEESPNSKDTNLDMNSENSKRRKLPLRNEEYDWRDLMMSSSDEEVVGQPTRRKEAKVSNGKKPATASSSKAESIELASTDESKNNSTEAELAVEQAWREKMRANEEKQQTERIELHSEGSRQGSDVPAVEAVPESLSGLKKRDDEVLIDSRRRNISQREEFPCPICSKNFPAEEIEVHAAGCEQYEEASSAGGSGSNSLVVPMSLGAPKQRDMFSNMPGRAELQDREVAIPRSRKKVTTTNAKKPPTASSSRTKSVERVSTNESKVISSKAKCIRQEERRIREEAASRRKVERVKQRLQEEAKKVKLEERNEKLRLSFEQTWREKVRAKRKVSSVEIVPEYHSGMKQSDVEVFSDDSHDNRCQPDRVLCPICSKNFSVGDIEVHAAHCEQYDAGSSADVSRSNSPVVAVSLETSKRRDILSNMPGQAGLQDDEVAEEFENDQREIVQSSSRLRAQRERLQVEQQKEDEAKLVVSEEQRVRDEETSRRDAERVEQRVQEAAKKAKLNELKEQRTLIMEQEREEQRQTERIESSPEGPRQVRDIPSTDVVPGNNSGMEQRDVEERGDERRRNLSQTEQVPCPICGISFPVDEIETHAARCVECVPSSSADYSTSHSVAVPKSSSKRSRKNTAGCRKLKSPVVPMSSRPPKRRDMFSTLLECYICSKFTARNGWEYEDHVTSCVARQRESR